MPSDEITIRDLGIQTLSKRHAREEKKWENVNCQCGTDTPLEPEIRASKMRIPLLKDWRQGLHTSHSYRVGNGTLRIQHQFIMVLLIVVVVPIILYTYLWVRGPECTTTEYSANFVPLGYRRYNSTYPITPVSKTAAGFTYRIGIISDLDKNSKDSQNKNTWYSILKRGHLFWMPRNNLISISWDPDETKLYSTLGMGGRGMELSELVTFDGRLLSCDDRTGIVYNLEGNKPFPWLILMDGSGKDSKGFKSEWATVKNEQLYIGSMGKEWTTSSGEFQHNNPLWVKIVSPGGEIQAIDWSTNYKKLRRSLNIEFPGYMIHESAAWSDVHKSWFFLPRRCSKERYNETKDEVMSCNVLLSTDESFANIMVKTIDNSVPIRGFSSFKFLPGSHDSIIVALKTEEYKGQTATYITAFTIEGQILLPDTKIVGQKFEGLEFV